MNEQSIKKQLAREYYNVIYGAKLNFASFDLCEKVPSLISFFSLSLGILGLAFTEFESRTLAASLLIVGLIGLMLKPREALKEQYYSAGVELTQLSKNLEVIHAEVDESDHISIENARKKLEQKQELHKEIQQPAPVLLATWFAHYKLFSEHNSKWLCEELDLTWKDKFPLSLRVTIAIAIFTTIIYLAAPSTFNKVTTFMESFC
ncbi:SLATT domain-containing protein [Photobacterium chitinilyticum]|uniref:SLATT domain-containing protein n=1 Tax=Photobacterium chitinilyticum TaxID=2485123 RepID=A0A3S3RGM8_9GAMM|nr:SLATT domain-containing protein [Photobacterium chitinilyticum]RWX54845.1 SLATT domain-containing protein [Photobacterium chitinilyticum]